MTPEPPAAVAEHNPSGITPAYVGTGWRKLIVGERIEVGDEWYNPEVKQWIESTRIDSQVEPDDTTYRRKLAPISPDEQSASQPLEREKASDLLGAFAGVCASIRELPSPLQVRVLRAALTLLGEK